MRVRLTTLKAEAARTPDIAYRTVRPEQPSSFLADYGASVDCLAAHAEAMAWTGVRQPEQFVATIRQGTVYGASALVGRGDAVFYDSVHAIHRLRELGLTPETALPGPPDWNASVSVPTRCLDACGELRPASGRRRVDGRAILLGFHWDANYFHWICETLPRLMLLDDLDAPLLLGRMSGFHRESLAAFGLNPDRVVCFGDDDTTVGQLVFLSRVNRSGFASRQAVDWLRARAPQGPGGCLRLFVSRADAGLRDCVNEAELLDALGRFGFKKVSLTGMPFSEQVRLFQQAEIIVGPHGAGFTNTVFHAGGLRIVELMPQDYVNPSFWSLALAAGHAYRCVLGAALDATGRFTVDPGAVVAAIA